MEPLPPERFDLGDALLRWVRPDDAAAIAAAARASYERLTPWMVWASSLDVLTEEAMTEFLTSTLAERAAGRSANYSFRTADDTACLGGIGVHERIGPGGVEIGYWLADGATGRGLVTRGATLLANAALACDGIDRVEIHCDEANERSAAVPERLGFDLDQVVDDGEFAIRSGRLMIWVRTSPITAPPG
ncbi:MAG: putative acetyltransferase [Acidimicrobiales bacterium]|nr:putative acetyltransferase [Acidimicrobiales bacterium]